jgi:hypothetical protein
MVWLDLYGGDSRRRSTHDCALLQHGQLLPRALADQPARFQLYNHGDTHTRARARAHTTHTLPVHAVWLCSNLRDALCARQGGPNTFFTLKPQVLTYPGPEGDSLTAEQAATAGLILDSDTGRWVRPTAPCPTPQASGAGRRQLQPVEAMQSLLPYVAPLLAMGGMLAAAAGQQAH